jgi:hypothetical protein
VSSAPSEQAWSTVDAALRAVRALDRMETACFVVVSATTASYLRVSGTFPGLDEGTHCPRADSLTARVLDGAPAAAAGVTPGHPSADTAEHLQLGVRSYHVSPVIRPDGRLLGVLVGLDRGEVPVSAHDRALVRGIADALGAAGDLPAAHPPGVSANGPRPAPAHPEPPATAAQPAPTADEAPAAKPAPAAETTPPSGPSAPHDRSRDETPSVQPAPATQPAPDAAGVESAGQPGPAAAAPRPPGRPATPTPQTIARAPRPGPPGRAGPPRPGPPPAAVGGSGPGGGPAGPKGQPTAPRRALSDMRLRRTTAGWIVEGPGTEVRPVGDLLSAMVLSDLLAEDLAPPGRPRRADRDLGEVEQLRLSVVQLEHALASRVVVEQAIGVLAERNQIRPREAFERLRRTARGMGRRVHDLARQVVDSVGDPRAVLPGELGGRPASPGGGAGHGGHGGHGGGAGGGPATPGGVPPGPGSGGNTPRPTPPRSASTRH